MESQVRCVLLVTVFKFQQTCSIYQNQQLFMKKYAVLFLLLIAYSSAQTCYKCKPQNCTGQVCTECENGFMLSSLGWCGLFTPIEGCRIYDVLNPAACKVCNSDRQQIDARCYIQPEGCEQSDLKSCLRCKNNYVLQRGKCLSTQVQNCPIGSLPTPQFCQPLRAQNCLQMSGDDKICSSCQPGYNLINGRCLRVRSTNSCPNNNCDCSLGFKLAQVCYRIEIDKCTYLRDPVYCAACLRGFVAIDGICLQPVKQDDVNCNVKAPLSDYCTGCNQDYQLNIDAFCYRNFSMSTCPVATGYFYVENGNCFYRDKRCTTIDQRGGTYQCLQCQEGFTLLNKFCERNICTAYALNGTCTQVFLGYAIVGINQFIKLPANCLTIDTQGRCIKCSDFTKLVPMNANVAGSETVCAYVDANCIMYNSNGSCLACANTNDPNGYVLRGRFCFMKADNCPRPDPTDLSKCLTCSINYHLDSTDSRCYANVAGCEVYLTGSDCKQCQAINYILYDRKCYGVNSDPNQACLDVDASNICRRCPNGLMPWKNVCVYYHPYCLDYGPDLVCSRAAGGWALSTMTQEQKQYYMSFMMRGAAVRNRNEAVNLNGLSIPSNAALAGAYSTGGLIGAFPYAGLLHTKISGVNMLGFASSCYQGYTLVNFACIQKVVGNCEFYSIDQICMRCSPGYTLLGDFTCAQGLQCATPQDVSNGRCNNCAAGYLKLGVQCFKIESSTIVDQYLQYSSFYRYSYSSTGYVAWPRLANCRTQNSPSFCSECQAPYQNFNGSCIIFVERCIDYGLYSRGQTPGSCLYCQNGYTYWFGQCRRLNCASTNGICTSCPASYYYYFGLCLANTIGNCRVYDSAVCANCNYGYYLSPQNQCLQEVSGCLTTNRDTGRCLQCRSSLVLYRERCVIQQKYCEDYDFNTNACIRCQMNTVNRTQLLPTGSCALLVGQCATVDINTKVCATCNPGYTPINQDGTILCVNFKTNCLTYDVRGRCIQCNKRYVLINNQCRIFSPFCIQFTDDFSKCTMCAPGSILENGCCKVPDQNCISYSNDCLCNKCLSRYYLNSSGLCALNEDGCQIYDFDTQKCIKCLTGYYYVPSAKKCYLTQTIINGCLTGFNITYTEGVGYQCLKCIDGFVLRQDNLCYGYNCIVYHPATRQCLNCPTYYQIYRGNNSNDQLNYCIPYFCQLYTPGQSYCSKNVTTYTGGHLIIVTTRTITITYCQAVDPQSNRCLTCTNFRYPNPQTLYGLCYPLHCKSQLNFDCQECQFGFSFNPQYPGSCLASFCSQYRNDGTCNSCIAPYTLNSAGLCENKGCCDKYNVVLGVCETAKKYYILQGNLCVPNNCVQFDVNVLTMCTKCSIGSTLFADGTCRVNNCQQETFGGDSCLVCRPGFIAQFSPNSLKSVCMPNYCDRISDDLNMCLKCKEGFTLGSDNLCRADYCAVYQSSLVCQTCISFFVLDKAERCVAQCEIGNGTRCQCCKFGSTLNINTGLCQPPAAFCAKNNTLTGLCDNCNTNYNLIMGQCAATMPNCRNHSLFGCVSCNPGFSLVNNCRCVPKNCNQVAANGFCAVCQPRFDLTPEGLCRPRDCQIFATDIWACNGCYSRFKFVNGACVTTNCQIWQDSDNTTCKQCGTVQQYSNGNFVATVIFQLELVRGGCYIMFCKNDPRTIVCRECVPGYKLTINGLCQCANYDASNQCVCPEGTVLNNLTKYCDSDTCLQRDFTTKACLQCPVWYYPPSLYNGECVPLYCINWQLIAPGNVQCRQCPPNFDLVNGLCRSTICQKFENKTGYPLPQCTVCLNGWVPYSNYCVPPKCEASTYNFTSAICVKCSDFGYILTPDRSRCMIANCEIEKLPISCSKCKIGFRFLNELCISNNCTVWNNVTCTACMQGFFLQNERCYAYNCATFGPDNLCLRCADGFKLTENLTCVRQYCDIDGSDTCVECIRGYTYNVALKWCVPSNCLTYSQLYSGCDKCLQGYYKENGTCIDIRCDFLSFTKEMKCKKCQDGMQFNNAGLCYPINTNFCPPGQYFSGGACVPNPVPSCSIYYNNTCLWCLDDFFLWNGLCYSIRFCTKYSYYFGCSECVVGYYLKDRQCFQNNQDPTCAQVSNGVCVRCQQGYSLVNGRCYLIPPNCLDVNEFGNCVRCAPGFTPISNICQSTDVNCLYFDSFGKCSRCRDGFNVDIQGKCQQTAKNCNATDSVGRCTQCNIGFALQNFRCYRFQPFCLQYSQTSELCVQCNTNFTLQANQCRCLSDSQFINNQICIRLPSNCLEVSTLSYMCVRCAQGYTLTNDFRCTIFISIENCSSYDPQTGNCKSCFGDNILVGNRCQACQNGYFASNNICYIRVNGCLEYSPNGACKTCQPGLKLDLITNTCSTITPPLNCATYDPLTGICSQCRPTFVLLNNNCISCPAGQVEFGGVCYTIIIGCISYSPNGVCGICGTGWYLDSGKCLNVTTPPNCMAYNLTTGVCYQCMKNYVLSGNTCIPCPAGQVEVGGKCYIIIVGCIDYLGNGDCRLCQIGKKLQSGKCVAISTPPFCAVYQSQTGVCTKCIAGYNLTMISGTPSCIINNCLTASTDGKSCITCVSPFTWTGQECRYETEFCLNYFNGRCQTCDTFASLTQFRCVPTFCGNYDYARGYCIGCIDRYQLVSRRCVLVIDGCSSYQINGCATCLPGYTLISPTLCQKQQDVPKFCTQYNYTSLLCVTCAPNYVLTSDFKYCVLINCGLMDPTYTICNRCLAPFSWNGMYCVFTTDFCLVYAGSGYCSSCQSWSRLDQNRCVPNFCLSYNYGTGSCETCVSGYTLSLTSKRCFVIIQYCLSYADTGLCIQCMSGYTLSSNGQLCTSSSVLIPSCYAQVGQGCSRCQHRYYLDTQMCSAYIKYCINIDPSGRCIACCFGSNLINGACQKQPTIKYCQSQLGNTCLSCMPGYSYCSFCQTCLPSTPNCNKYQDGSCVECYENFMLANGVCISQPVGVVLGATGTCRAGYYSKDSACYRNENDLRLYSAIQGPTPVRASSSALDFYTITTSTNKRPIVIFAIVINSQSVVNPSASFLLYYRSKISDPLVCWNSCIPTPIDSMNYIKNLAHPIVASEIMIYVVGGNLQAYNFDFKVLA